MSTDNQHPSLEGWTKTEKFELFQALSEYGSSNILEIKTFLTTKTEKQIQDAINYYKSKAFQNSEIVNRRKRRCVDVITAPLTSWASKLEDTKCFDDLKTEIAVALRLIALFEERPSVKNTEGYDFAYVYHTLANALDGKKLSSDEKTKTILEKCIVDTAHMTKTFRSNSVIKNIIDKIDLSDNRSNVYIGPLKPVNSLKDSEHSNIKYLISQKEYNPLQLSENDVQF